MAVCNNTLILGDTSEAAKKATEAALAMVMAVSGRQVSRPVLREACNVMILSAGSYAPLQTQLTPAQLMAKKWVAVGVDLSQKAAISDQNYVLVCPAVTGRLQRIYKE